MIIKLVIALIFYWYSLTMMFYQNDVLSETSFVILCKMSIQIHRMVFGSISTERKVITDMYCIGVSWGKVMYMRTSFCMPCGPMYAMAKMICLINFVTVNWKWLVGCRVSRLSIHLNNPVVTPLQKINRTSRAHLSTTDVFKSFQSIVLSPGFR